MEKQGTYKAGDDEVEAEEDFDIDDVYTNEAIPHKVWESYCDYLDILGSYLKKGTELGFSGELKGILVRKCFRAALKVTNKRAKRGAKLKNLWGRQGYS
jgi:hypothetical protein